MFQHTKRVLIYILILLVLSSCKVVRIDVGVEQPNETQTPATLVAETSPATEVAIATPWIVTATPTPNLATQEPTETAIPTATIQPTPKPQVIITQQPTSIPQATVTAQPLPACSLRYFFNMPPNWGGTWRASCPENQALATTMAEQRFQYGRMLWVEATNSIYVLWGNGIEGHYSGNKIFTDTWTENEAPANLDLNPPEGYQVPIRGFGKVWAEDRCSRENLGWAVTQERGFEGIYQRSQIEQNTYKIYLRTDSDEIIAIYPWNSWEYVFP